MAKVKIEVGITGIEKQSDTDDGDDEVIVVPYVKPPPTLINLAESDEEEQPPSKKSAKKKSKKKDKDKDASDTASKSSRSERQGSPLKEKSSKRKKASDDSAKRSKDFSHKSKRKKSTKDSGSRTDFENDDPGDANIDDKSKNTRHNSRKTTTGSLNDSISRHPTSSNIFQPSSAALIDPTYQQDSNSSDASDRQRGWKRKASLNWHVSPSHTKKCGGRVRTNSSKSAEEESIEDSIRFVQLLGLPVVVPSAESENDNDNGASEDELCVPCRKKKTAEKSKSPKKSKKKKKERDVVEEESEPQREETIRAPDFIEDSAVPDIIAAETESHHTTPLPSASENPNGQRDEALSRPHIETLPQSEPDQNLAVQEDDNDGNQDQESSIKRVIPLLDIFPYQWTPEMKRYYGEAITDTEDVDQIKAKQSDDTRLWRIDLTDVCSRRPLRPGILCFNCNQIGHKAPDCPAKIRRVCPICGAPGHTDFSHCPNALCLSCGSNQYNFQRGCQKCILQGKPVQCSICGMTGHSDRNCPDHWRRYYKTTDFGLGENTVAEVVEHEQADNEQRPSQRKFPYVHRFKTSCANCGESRHNYFNCKRPRATDILLPHKPFIINQLSPEDLREIDIINVNCSHPNEFRISSHNKAANQDVVQRQHERDSISANKQATVQTNRNDMIMVPDSRNVRTPNHVSESRSHGRRIRYFNQGGQERSQIQQERTRSESEGDRSHLHLLSCSPPRGRGRHSSSPRPSLRSEIQQEHTRTESEENRNSSTTSPRTGQDPKPSSDIQQECTPMEESESSRSSLTRSPRRRHNSRSPLPNQRKDSESKNVRDVALHRDDQRRIWTDSRDSADKTSSGLLPTPTSSTVPPPAPIVPIFRPPPGPFPQPQSTSTNFFDDLMIPTFDVDERKFTPEDLAQTPYLSLPFVSPTKEYIAIPLHIPPPVVQTATTPSLSLPYNVFPNQAIHNPLKKAAMFFNESERERNQTKDNNRKQETSTPTTVTVTGVTVTPVLVAAPAPSRPAANEPPVPAPMPSDNVNEKQPESPEVIVLD